MNPETYPFNAVIRAAPDKGGAYVIFPTMCGAPNSEPVARRCVPHSTPRLA